MKLKKATFGGGCFWCTEAVFLALEGVVSVTSGYTGGQIENPTYKQVCTGETGHAEVVEITYDETKISFTDLLLVFFKTHDPTTLNRQGADVGTQYRSAVFYHTPEQHIATQDLIKQLSQEQIFDSAIVTEVTEAQTFYPSEAYHHNYFVNNRSQPYCMAVIEPKLAKFAQNFKDKIKPELL